jgi:hypothetical protein
MLSRAKKCRLFRQWPMPSIINYILIETENDSYWQKISFHFLQNIWKCSVFEHLHIFAKSTNLTPKYVFPNKINMEYQKTLDADYDFVKLGMKKCSGKKLKAKNSDICMLFRLCIFQCFLPIIFGNICLNPYQQIFNWHKILRFWYPKWNFWDYFCINFFTFDKFWMHTERQADTQISDRQTPNWASPDP